MALYLGEAVRLRATATDPETGLPLTPTGASVDFWAPGKNPIKDPDVRAFPDVGNQPMVWRPETQDFVLVASTTGPAWTAGKWTYRVTVQGEAFSNWEFSTFTLKP